MKKFTYGLVVLALSIFPVALNAATITSTATGGAWATGTTWAGGNVPLATDDVIIATGATVTVSANATCATLVFQGAVAGSATVSISSGITLNVTGAITIPRAVTNPNLNTITVGAGILNAGSIAFTNGGTAVRHSITISTGTVTVTGNVTQTGSNGSASIIFSGAGTLRLGGTFLTPTTGTLTTFAGSTVEYYRAGAQTAGVFTYSNLTLSGSGTKTFATTPTINGVLSMEGTATVTVTTGVVTYGAAATLQYNTATARTTSTEEWITPFAGTGGVIIANTGTITMNAAKVFSASVPLTISSGSTLSTSGSNLQLTLGGNFVNSGTLSAGSSAVVIANTMVGQSIAGFTTTGIVSMTKTAGIATFTGSVNGGGLTINGTGGSINLGSGLNHTFTGTWTRTAGTLDGGSSTINFSSAGAVVSGSTGTFTPSTGTVNYNRAGTQTVGALTYNNLTLSGTSTKTTTGITVNGILSMEGTATASAAPTYGANATLVYMGSAAQTTGAEFPATWAGTGGVKIENASGVTLNSARSVGAQTFYIGSIVPNSVFNDGGFQLTATGTLNLTSGTYNVKYSSFPAFTTTNILTGTTVDYSATATQTVKGITYSNLSISGTGTNSKTADTHITVNGILNLSSANASATQGALSMSTFTLNMGATATTIGTGDVTGIVTRNTFVVNTPYSFGNAYTTLNLATGGTLPTSVSFKITLSATHAWKADAINRYYDIIQTGGDASTLATLNLFYLDNVTELNSQLEANLVLFDYVISPPSVEDHGTSNSDIGNNWVGLANLSLTYLASGSFDTKYWTLGSRSTGNDRTWTGASNTVWGNSGNWTGGLPGVSSNVFIPITTNDPVLPASATINSINILAGGVLDGGTGATLTIAGGAGAWNNLGAFNATNSTVIFTSALATLSDSTNFYNVTIADAAILTLGTNSVMDIAGTLSLSSSGVLNAASNHNTVEYNKAGDQTVVAPNGSTSGYHNLILSGSGTKTMPGTALSIGMDFIVKGSASVTAGNSLTVEGNVSLASGATFNASTFTHYIKGNWTNNGATFTPGTSNVTFNNTSSAQAINGSVATQSFNSITVAKTAQTLSVGGTTATLNLSGALTITSGTFDKGTAATINIAGSWANTGTFTAGSGTVDFNGASGASAVISGTNIFNNLIISGTGNNNKTASGTITVNGTLSLNSANYSATQGCLHMTGTNQLIMGATATTDGPGDLTGIVTRNSFVVNTPYSFGNEFTTLDLAAGGTLPTSVSFRITLSTDHTWKANAIHRYYSIIQTSGDAATKATLNLHYLDGELNGINENTLGLFDYHVTPATTHDHGYSNADAADNWVGLANLSITYIAPNSSDFGVKYFTLGTSTVANFTWLGTSTVWTNTANWSGAVVPTATDHVVIPDAAGTAFDPTLPASTSIIGSINIQALGVLNGGTGTTLTITGGAGAWDNVGTFNAGTSTVVFTNAAATMADPTNFYNVTVADGASLTLGTDNIMRIEGTLSLSTTGVLNAANNHNTVEYNGTDQTVVAPNGSTPGYHNLILSGSGTKTMPATALNIGMDFTISGTASVTAAQDIVVAEAFTIGAGTTFNGSSYSLSVGKNWSKSLTGTFTCGTGTVVFTGATAQTITGTNTFNNLTISGAGGVTAGADQTVNGVLDLAGANPSSTKGLLEMTDIYGSYPGTTITDYLDSYMLNMGANATTTGIGDVTGTVKRATIVANTPYSFGNQFTTISLTPGVMPSALAVTITIGTTVPGPVSGTDKIRDAIRRTYEIVPTGGSGSYVTANFHYLDSELTSSLSPYHVNTELKLTTMDYDIDVNAHGASASDEHGRANFDYTNNFIGLSSIPISYFIQIPETHEWRTIFTLGDYFTDSFTWNGSTNADWKDSLNWTPTGVPDATSHVIIPDAGLTANDPVLPANNKRIINTLAIQDGGILTMNDDTLTIANNLSGGWEDQNLIGNDPGTSRVIFSTPSTIISGNARFYDVEIGTGADITNQAGSKMIIGNTMTKTGSWFADVYANTVEYNKADAQAVVEPTGGYHHLTLSGTSAKTLPGALTMNGNFTLSGTASATATGALTISGDVVLNSGATFNGSNYTHNVKGNWTNDGGTFTPNSSNINFNNTVSGQSINGTAASQTFNIITVAKTAQSLSVGGSTTTLALDTLTITTGTFDAGSASNINVTGDWTNTSGTFSAGISTVDFTSGSAQKLGGANTFNNLTISGAGGVTAGANQTVNGTLALTSAFSSTTKGCLSMTDPYELIMGASSSTSGDGDVSGIVTRNSFLVNTPYSFGSPYTSLILSAGGTLPSTLSVKLTKSTTHAWKANSIDRYYDIIQTGGNSATKVNLNLHYQDGAELNGLTEGNFDLFDGISAPMTDDGHSSFNTSNNWVGISNLDLTYVAQSGFGSKYWTIGATLTPTCTWDGSESTVWATALNWDGGIAPTSIDHVIIPDEASTANDPAIPETASILSISIQINGILNGTTGTPTLTLTGGPGAWENLGTYNAGSSTIEFSNAAATMSGSTNFNNVNVTTTGTLTPETNNVMGISGTLTVSGSGFLNAAYNHNTIDYNGAGQTIIVPNGSTSGYHNLILSNSGTKAMPSAPLSILGDFTLSGTASVSAADEISVTGDVTLGSGTVFVAGAYTHVVSGNWINNGGTFTQTGSIINFNSSSLAQAINGSETVTTQTFNSIIVSKPGQTLSVGGSTTTLTLGGDLSINSGTFDAGTATTINVAGNWVNNGAYTAGGAGLVTFNGSSAQTLNGTTTFHDLTLSSTGVKTITSGAAITVGGDLTNSISGGDALKAARFVIESGPTSDGSLIHSSSGVLASVQRYMKKDFWHIVSIPTSGQAIGSFVSNVNNYIGYSASTSSWAMRSYSPAQNIWNPYYTSGESSNFNVGEGYLVHRKSSSVDGVVTSSGSLDGRTINLSGLTAGKWNCIGNPYTSAIGVTASSLTASNFLAENAAKLDLSYGAIYIWNEQTGYTGPSQRSDYVALNNAGYVSLFDKSNLQAGQGFLVKMENASITLSFTAGMKTHLVSEPFLKKSFVSWPGFELFATGTNLSNNTIVTFFEGMTTGLDPSYDAGALKGNPDIAIYTRLVKDNGTDFKIQCLPLEGLDTLVIPVGIDLPAGGEITFSAKTELIPSGSKVIFEDRQLGILTDLVANPSGYVVTLPVSTFGTGRFFLHTGEGEVHTNLKPDEVIQVYSVGKKIYLNGETTPKAMISLYSIQGVLIKVFISDGSVHQQFDANGITDGVYLMSITDKQKKRTYKLFL
jgi:hypothetical protein